MSSVTVAASAARYGRGAATARERSRLASNHGAVDRCDLTDDDRRLFSAGVRGSRIGVSCFKIPLSLGAIINVVPRAPCMSTRALG
jgi:hypothetical protein